MSNLDASTVETLLRQLLAAMTALGVTHLELTPGDDDHAPPPAADPEPREQARAG